jgi:NADH-quinone oxidoreductase subunit J
MSLGTILFLILGLIAVTSAIGMLTSTNAVHAALFLVVNFATIALFYLGLNAPFLAMVQITVYAGAIMVLFLFVIMLLGAEQVELTSRLRWQAPVGLVLVVSLIIVAGIVLFNPDVRAGLGEAGPLEEGTTSEDSDFPYGGPHSVGDLLFDRYLLPFEMTGILLLAAMVGAIVLAREDKPVRKQKVPQIEAQKQAEAAQLPSGGD